MRLAHVSVLAMLGITSCGGGNSRTTAMPPAQVLKVDDEHWMRERPDGSKAPLYRISPCASLLLDATGYTFELPPELKGRNPNSIQLVQGKTRKYEMAWETGKTCFELSSANLRPLPGSQGFQGFKAGDKAVIAVGILFEPGQLAVLWVGMIEVQ